LKFALREGGKTIAAGVISKILKDDDPNEVKSKVSGEKPKGVVKAVNNKAYNVN